MQPALDRDLFSNQTHSRSIRSVDMEALVAAGRALLDQQPRTPKDLGALLHDRWPDTPPATLAYAIRNQVPLVQVPPRGVWHRSGPIAHTTAETWLGPNASQQLTLEHLVRRYLAAFGPATVKDIQTWSGLTRLREITDRIQPSLVTYRDQQGGELFDLPDAPRPDPETPADPRFL